MAKNLNQIATAAASILPTDKMYIARSPFGVTDDRYILGSSIISQLASPLTTKGDLYTFSTVDARLAVGSTNGQILQVDSASAVGLSWSTPTYPSASGAAGKILISDGTNNIYSTPTYPNTAGTSGSIIISDGTNKINSTSLWPNTVGTALHLVLSNGTSNVYSTPAYPNASVTAGKLIISDGTNYIASTSVWPNTVGTVGKIIRSDGTTNAYTTSTFADTYSVNNILYASSANTVVGLATLANAVLVTDGTGVPSLSTTLPAGLTIPGYQPTLTLPLSLANGGTNASLVASTGGIFYSTASAAAILSGTATARQMLQSGATAAPSWSTSTWPATTTANQILYSSATNTVSEIISAASSVLITSAGSVPSLSQTLPAAVQGNITTVGTITSGTWHASIIELLYGGTNAALTASLGGIVYSTATAMAILAGTATAGQMLQSGSTAAPTWSTAAWPATTTANQLLYSSTNNNVTGLASTARAVLGSSSAGVPNWLAMTDGQLIIGSTAGAPAAASLSAGAGISITPGSNSISIAASSGSGSPLTTKGDIYVYSTTNTRLPVGTTDGQILQVSSGATTGLAYSTPTYPSASGTSGLFLISNGTNNVYSTSTIPTSAGATANKHLISDGTNYVLSTPTFPNSASGTGTILRADGTNWVATTTTYPNTNAVNTLLYASSANVMAALATANSSVLVTDGSGVPSLSTTLPTNIAVTTPKITTGIKDSNGNTIFGLTATASAVNNIYTQNTATGNAVLFGTTGTDAAVPLQIGLKNANLYLTDTTGTIAPHMRFYNAASTHYTSLGVTTSAAGDLQLILPNTDGAKNAALVTSGAGTLSFSDGLLKVWCNKVGNSTTVNASLNVSSTTHASTGVHVISFTTAFANTSYVTCANSLISATLQFCMVQSQATGSVSINTYNTSGTATDPTQLLVMCAGTQ